MRGTEFAELAAFVAVAERNNFARSASYLGIAPSTLSQTIRALEERLGIRLFNRTTRSVALTEAGEKLLAKLRPAFEELGQAVESINDFRDTPAGTLRLSVSTTSAHMILAPIIKAFLAQYPAITLDIVIDDSAGDIVSGRFDAGIRYGRRLEKDMLIVRASPESRIIAMASKDYLARNPQPRHPRDLQSHPCIRLRLANEELLPWEFQKNSEKLEIAAKGPLIVNNMDLMVKAALDGIGIGYAVEAYIAEHINKGALVPLLQDWSPTYYSYYLYYASRRQLPVALKLFIDFLRTQVREREKGN